ncbi:MAG: hypothetical protein IJ282_05950 [Lachnospiraceae bacterium]|nr:hypothetical protein [Lachnospiraceae bacterium]
MAKKFGKFLLFTTVAAAAAAGAYYYFKKKSDEESFSDLEDEDYDDFSEDLDEEETPRSYVQLNLDETATANTEDDFEEIENGSEGDFAPLADQLQEKKDEQVEEFFGEEN